MNVVELGSRLSWWRGALWGVVLAVAAGVLGMHVLTAGHSVHGVGAGGHVTEPGTYDGGVVAAEAVTSDGEHGLTEHGLIEHGLIEHWTLGHVHAGDQAASTDMSFSLASSPLGGTAPEDAGRIAATHVVASIPACDTDCSSAMGSVCLAVILLALVLLRRRPSVRGRLQAARISLANFVPALGVGPPRPSLLQLCVSRT